ncbi:MAG TPA: BlaI/MecI/CopY family transcriptional regulator, partial [Terriglobales bacterium]|nr:BlaI/MecI/CopY family transcriptional regulator [Terriglobales bacterium]
ASVAEVRAALARPLAYTTVMTVLDRMSGKGLVERRKNGRAYLYSAVLDLDNARRDALTRLLANLFDNDRDALARYVSRLRPGAASPLGRPASRAPKRPKPAARETGFVPSLIDDSLL